MRVRVCPVPKGNRFTQTFVEKIMPLEAKAVPKFFNSYSL